MNTFNKPTLVTITAPTCSGKNYLINTLEGRAGFSKIISTTTRALRTGEKHGKDYVFKTKSEFNRLEADDAFVEVNSFCGEKYGVQRKELATKLANGQTPVIILEPAGVEEYRFICKNYNLDIFTVYVSAVESLRIERLLRRSLLNVGAGQNTESAVKDHMSRYAAIIGEERRWSNTNVWDAIIPGDNIEEAVRMINQGITWRNQRNATTVTSRLNSFVI